MAQKIDDYMENDLQSIREAYNEVKTHADINSLKTGKKEESN